MKCKTCGEMNCMAHGGKMKGVHEPVEGRPGSSRAGLANREGLRGDGEAAEESVSRHKSNLKDLKALPKPKLQGLAKGGEVEDEPEMGDDHELNDMVAGELLEAFEKKDKQGILDAMKALIMNCKE